ncbi:MAG: sigma-70 family RNA polymerase sigma factor [Bryobacteraceae bacterium]|jgi:RNA polymerase sigma-70 factor (ECF subfamily)|nr:sigma-70 family RNA polymerase sigma factor [Bryobacteraceae bacterium]
MSGAGSTSTGLSPQALARLVEGREQFLAFLRKRVSSEAAAEDILQSAFVRGIEKGGAVRDEESVVAWFYRLLRNAVIDHYRQTGSAERASGELARHLTDRQEPDDPLKGEICRCVMALLDTVKPEYREALETIDLNEGSLADLASKAGVTSNNAAVRIHRAREALRKRVAQACGLCAIHGCLDCQCGKKATE